MSLTCCSWLADSGRGRPDGTAFRDLPGSGLVIEGVAIRLVVLSIFLNASSEYIDRSPPALKRSPGVHSTISKHRTTPVLARWLRKLENAKACPNSDVISTSDFPHDTPLAVRSSLLFG